MDFIGNLVLTLASSQASVTSTTDVAQQGDLTTMLLTTILPFGIMIGLLYLVMIRPQKKKDKQAQAMRDNVHVGDEVITNGGIIGRVVSVKEDTIVIETGSDRSKVRIKKWAIASNETIHDEDIV